jgi:translation initiation factor IF-3
MDLDLVEVAAEANPPVCKIMDYNRFKYEAAQRAKESRRKATSTGIKEMKYRPKIGVGDFDTKTRQVARFLSDGHKVKITIMFRGREMSHPELGKKILDQVAEQVASVAKVEAAPKLDGRNMVMVLAPDRRSQVRKTSTSGQAEHREAEPSPNGARPASSRTPASQASPAADTGDRTGTTSPDSPSFAEAEPPPDAMAAVSSPAGAASQGPPHSELP